MERKKSKLGMGIVVAVVLLLGIGAAVYALTMQPNESKTENSGSSNDNTRSSDNTDSSNDDSDTSTSNMDGQIHLVFTDDGFVKPEISVPRDTLIVVENKSNSDMQFSSDEHPTHTEHPELNMEVLAPGESGSFRSPKTPGRYDYHDHINDEFTGTLIVE